MVLILLVWISKWWNQSWANIHWIERLGSLSNRSIHWWKCWIGHLKNLFKFWLWWCWFIQNILFLIIFFDRLTFIRLFKHFSIRACAMFFGCVFPIVVVSMLPHVKFGPNDHWDDAPRCIKSLYDKLYASYDILCNIIYVT